MVTLQKIFVSHRANGQAYAALFKHTSWRNARRILRLSRAPIIIGGCGRSGTTLLLSILSAHPKIFAIAIETTALCSDGYGADGLYNRNPDLEAPFRLEKIYEQLRTHDIPASCTRWCEKTPRNVIYFERILRHFGKRARVIHLVRDGRDVVTSVHPTDRTRYWITPHRWVMDVTAGRRMENHPQVLTLRYEDLVRDYETTLRGLCEFIGETFAPELLQYPHSARVQESLAWLNPAQGMNDRSIGRWREAKYEAAVAALLHEPGALSLLEHYGYAMN